MAAAGIEQAPPSKPVVRMAATAAAGEPLARSARQVLDSTARLCLMLGTGEPGAGPAKGGRGTSAGALAGLPMLIMLLLLIWCPPRLLAVLPACTGVLAAAAAAAAATGAAAMMPADS